MLYIKTDLENTNWLKYILEEFKRINCAKFDIETISTDQYISARSGSLPVRQAGASGGNGENVIHYSSNPVGKASIVNRSHITPCREITYIEENLFIIQDTETNDSRFSCGYDILWNAFVFLSRLEEYNNEISGKKIHSYSSKHPRKDKSSFDIPIVNYLFNVFERLIKKNFPSLGFGGGEKAIIELSHDLDYIDKTIQLRIKQTAFNAYNTIKSIVTPNLFLPNLKRTFAFFFTSPSYWCFDYWENLEKQYNKRSVFYVYANTGKKNLKNWLIDPSYKISHNKKLIGQLKHLLEEGFEIGLHGSFYSSINENLISKEKELLEEIIRCEVTKTRQHWLRYEENITPYIHNKYFKFDSSIAWNDRMGFRAGCASKYRPYDHRNNQAFNFYEIPQVIMDSNIYDYGAQQSAKLMEKAISLLKELDKYKSAHVAISWHQRVCSNDYKWHKTYEKLIKL